MSKPSLPLPPLVPSASRKNSVAALLCPSPFGHSAETGNGSSSHRTLAARHPEEIGQSPSDLVPHTALQRASRTFIDLSDVVTAPEADLTVRTEASASRNTAVPHKPTVTQQQDSQYLRQRHGVRLRTRLKPEANNANTSAVNAGLIPPEILLWIVDCFVGGPIPNAAALEAREGDDCWHRLRAWEGRNLHELVNVALVCRTWFDRVTPLLYSRICVLEPDAHAFSSTMRSSGSLIAQHARKVHVKGLQPWTAAARLARQLPAVFSLEFTSPVDPHSPPFYCPSHFRAIAQAHAAFTNVRHVAFANCHFLSSLDLLRLLASFPALSSVSISYVSVGHVSDTIPACRVSHLREIRLDLGQYRATAPPLAYVLTWPFASPSGPLPGLPFSEAQTVARILTLLNPDEDFHLYRDADTSDETWVAWIRTTLFHLEFHVARAHGSNGNAAYRVHWVVMRYRGRGVNGCFSDGAKGLRKLDQYLAGLEFLQSVTLETTYVSQGRSSTAQGFVQVGPGRLHRRTCQQAYKSAKYALDDGEGVPLSPLWHDRRYVKWRNAWLPDESWYKLGTPAPLDAD